MNPIHLNSERFSLIASTDYEKIEKLASQWELEAAHTAKVYQIYINETLEEQTRIALEKERMCFNECEAISWIVNRAADSSSNPSQHMLFYLCQNDKEQIEGIMAISKHPEFVETEPFLKLDYLVTHPKNLPSTLALEFRPISPIRGVGSYLLCEAEKISTEKNYLGVILNPLPSTESFYAKHHYIKVKQGSRNVMMKRVDQTAQEILKAA